MAQRAIPLGRGSGSLGAVVPGIWPHFRAAAAVGRSPGLRRVPSAPGFLGRLRGCAARRGRPRRPPLRSRPPGAGPGAGSPAQSAPPDPPVNRHLREPSLGPRPAAGKGRPRGGRSLAASNPPAAKRFPGRGPRRCFCRWSPRANRPAAGQGSARPRDPSEPRPGSPRPVLGERAGSAASGGSLRTGGEAGRPEGEGGPRVRGTTTRTRRSENGASPPLVPQRPGRCPPTAPYRNPGSPRARPAPETRRTGATAVRTLRPKVVRSRRAEFSPEKR